MTKLTAIEEAVLNQLGWDEDDWCNKNEDLVTTLEDIINCGIAGGFSGFIYCTDTVEFYERNQQAIKEMVEELAESLGESAIALVKGFNWLDATEEDVAKTLYTKEHDRYVANHLAWFCAEKVARTLLGD